MTIDDNSDCLMLMKCEYYAMEDNFFPVRINKPLRFLMREVTWAFLHVKKNTI